jgi:hypothetical protein
MKRLNSTTWTDGTHNYTGNPKEGFTRVVDSDSVKLVPAPQEVRVDIKFDDEDENPWND